MAILVRFVHLKLLWNVIGRARADSRMAPQELDSNDDSNTEYSDKQYTPMQRLKAQVPCCIPLCVTVQDPIAFKSMQPARA